MKKSHLYIVLIIISYCISQTSNFFLSGIKSNYSDIIVGDTTWVAYNKISDTIGVILFLLFFSIGAYVIEKYKIEENTLVEFNINNSILKMLIVFLITLFLIKGNLYYGTLIVLVYLYVLFNYLKKINFDSDSEILKFIIYKFFVVISFSCTLVFIISQIFFKDYYKYNDFYNNLSLIIFIIIELFFYFKLYNNKKKLKFFINFFQIFIGFLFLIPINVKYLYNEEIFFKENTKVFTIICLFLFFSATSYSIYFFIKNLKTTKYKNIGAIITIIFFRFYNNNIFLPIYDYYHSGELLLPYKQLFEYNMKAYSEYTPIQGGLAIIVGVINKYVFNDSFSAFPMTQMLLYLVFIIIFGLLIYKINEYYLYIFLLFGFVVLDRYYFILISFLIIYFLIDKKKKKYLPYFYFLLCILNYLYLPTMGVTFSLVVFPFILLNFKSYKLGKNIALIMITGIIFLLKFSNYLVGSLVYLKENSKTNSYVWGIGKYQYFPTYSKKLILNIWENESLINDNFKQFIWEMGIFSCIFLLLPFLIYLIIIKRNKYKKLIDLLKYSSIEISLILLIFILFGYLYGRIDGYSLSRIGVFSFLYLYLIIILEHKIILKKKIMLIVSSFLISFFSITTNSDLFKILDNLNNIIILDETFIYVKDGDNGIENMGTTFINKKSYKKITDFNYFIENVLNEKETFCSLTDQSAIYYMINRKIPTNYEADYNAGDKVIQQHFIDGMNRNNCEVIWIGPRVFGDKASLRSYRIYKEIMKKNFRAVSFRNLDFLISEEKFMKIEKTLVNELKKNEEDIINRNFQNYFLGYIPNVWGESYKKMKSMFSEVSLIDEVDYINIMTNESEGHYIPKFSDAYIEYKTDLNPKTVDFLLINFDRDGKFIDDETMQVFFKTDKMEAFDEKYSIIFKVRSGEVLIPIAVQPIWYKAEKITGIRIDYDFKKDSKISKLKVLGLELKKE